MRKLQATNGTSLCILTQDPLFRLNEHCYFKFFLVGGSTLRLVIIRSDSELLIFIFRSEKRMGLLMKSDFAKSDGINLI